MSCIVSQGVRKNIAGGRVKCYNLHGRAFKQNYPKMTNTHPLALTNPICRYLSCFHADTCIKGTSMEIFTGGDIHHTLVITVIENNLHFHQKKKSLKK